MLLVPRSFRFEWPHYSGKEVEWTFQTHPNGFSIDVKNVGELDVELAWNEARWRSSFQDNWDDFLVYEQFYRSIKQSKARNLGEWRKSIRS